MKPIPIGKQPGVSLAWLKWFIPIILLLLVYVAWPYVTVFQLNNAVAAHDQQALAELVDLGQVRDEIKKKLNKDMSSSVGDVSNGFIEWIQNGLSRLGAEAVDQLVSLDWVYEQLLSKTPSKDFHLGFKNQVSYAFFDSVDSFWLQIGQKDKSPVHVQLRFQGLKWRVSAIYD